MDNLYEAFIEKIDEKLAFFFDAQKEHICCKEGCSECCEKGDYPLTEIELRYVMQGYMALDNFTKIQVQSNIKNIVKGGACPFLIDKRCSIYKYRPIICRVHGLAYKYKSDRVKVPYCTVHGKNFSKICEGDIINVAPIKTNLDTLNLLEGVNHGEMRNLYDWLIESNKQK